MRPKIATCCYCGTRAALVLRGRDRHELSCASCGAPLTRLKAMPVAGASRPAPQGAAASPVSRRRPAPDRGRPEPHPQQMQHRNRRKRRKPVLSRLLGEIWDVLEDVLD